MVDKQRNPRRKVSEGYSWPKWMSSFLLGSFNEAGGFIICVWTLSDVFATQSEDTIRNPYWRQTGLHPAIEDNMLSNILSSYAGNRCTHRKLGGGYITIVF